MLDNYLQILNDSLVKKDAILAKIEALSSAQAQMIEEGGSCEDIDANMDQKAELISELELLDDGFESLYDKIKAELDDHKSEYKKEIKAIQKLIGSVMDKSASIQAIEARNKKAMEKRFADERKELSQRKVTQSVAYDYYKTTSKLQAVGPQFLEKKK